MIQDKIHQALARYEQEQGHRLEPVAVLFDMDGVLYDSMPAHERSWLETAQHYGLPMTAEDVYMFEGQTGSQTIDILIERRYGRRATAEEQKAIYEQKTRLFNEYNTGALIPNVASVLAAVAHLDRIVVTGSSQGGLLDKLNDNFPNVFSRERMVTGMDVNNGKPHPEPYQRGMALANTKTYQSIAIENAPSGVRSAVTAGCFTIAVNTGPLPDAVLANEGAHLVFSDMSELCQALPLILSV
ncbi:MAG: HAD-IA family hydrolase [Porphyromonas sp.]|nr:HAD-IA family hydrolase [Porphyromonas sp.]